MILTYDDLKKTAGGKNPAQVVANLEQMKIKYVLRPDGKPVSTIDAINAAMRLRPGQKALSANQQDIEI